MIADDHRVGAILVIAHAGINARNADHRGRTRDSLLPAMFRIACIGQQWIARPREIWSLTIDFDEEDLR
jgi:hypothetical protein